MFIDEDGSNIKRSGIVGAEPVWSPDRNRILFTDSGINTITVEGGDRVRLTEGRSVNAEGNWSPDGERIVFVSDRDENGNLDIYVMNDDGTNVTRLTDHPSHDLCPAWSPDGTTIAFGSPERADTSGLYLMNADGSDVRLLVADTHEEPRPSWSPDGTQIVFQVEEDAVPPTAVEEDGVSRPTDVDLWVVNRDGTGLTQITDTVYDDGEAEWSPDGTRIVFNSDRTGSNEIWVINTDGTNPIQLTDNPGYDGFADW